MALFSAWKRVFEHHGQRLGHSDGVGRATACEKRNGHPHTADHPPVSLKFDAVSVQNELR